MAAGQLFLLLLLLLLLLFLFLLFITIEQRYALDRGHKLHTTARS